jgi:putative protease
VTHYYSHAGAAIVQIEHGEIRVGDMLHFRGHTTDFRERAEHIELDHQQVERATAGQTVGVHVSQRVREHDRVVKVTDG